MTNKKKIIGVIGLGYVGLPLALEFSKKFKTIAFDINRYRIKNLSRGIDKNNETNFSKYKKFKKDIKFTYNIYDLHECNYYIIAVPTPINKFKNPEMKYLIKATNLVAKILKKKDVVIYESTVYPGATENICGSMLEKLSNLKIITNDLLDNNGFYLGYSPERINPGDRIRTLPNISKLVSGSSPKAFMLINGIYSKIIKAGTIKVDSIQIAEAAKVIENTQRDVNIALMNEFAIIFDKLQISSSKVFNAAATKWNFLKFKPGLVGGHCIGIDPYYLSYISKKFKHDPKVILSGRYTNEYMVNYCSDKILKTLKKNKIKLKEAHCLFLGVTFKPNCSDIRNSKNIELLKSISKKINKLSLYDNLAEDFSNLKSNKISILKKINYRQKYSMIIYAVCHSDFKVIINKFQKNKNNLIFDLTQTLNPDIIEGSI